MIENFSRCWGGSGDIMVAFDGEADIPSALWAPLERYDPDRVGYYVHTRLGQKMAEPEAFEEWLNAQAKLFADQSDATSYEEARELLLADHVMKSPMTGWRPPSALEAKVKRHLAPLDRDRPFDHTWIADGPPGNELLDITNIQRPGGGTPVFAIRATDIDPRVDLMLISRLGAISPSLKGALKNGDVAVVEIAAKAEHLRTVLALCWERDIYGIIRRAEFMKAVGGTAALPWPSQFLDRVPFSLTEQGCSWYIIGRPWRRNLPQVVVVGDGAEDYSLALLLDRMYQQGYWCPHSFLSGTDEIAKIVKTELALRLVRGGDDEEKIWITSVTLVMEELASLLPELAQDGLLSGQLAARLEIHSPNDLQLPKPFRLYDREEILRQRYEPFLGPQMAGTLNTPRPSGISPVSARNFTWHVDALVDGVQFPPRSCLSPLVAVFGFADEDSVRASSDGISYFSREPFFIPAGASLEQMTYRPRLRQPDATEVFQELLRAADLHGMVSQAGRYSQGALALWGGLEAFARDLADPHRNALFEAYRKKTRSGEDPGVWLHGAKRRYLSFWDARRATGLTRDEMRAVLDTYVERGILTRGLCLKCPRCSFAAWYPNEEVGQRFRCSRCRAESAIAEPVWRKPSEPLWFYQLDEIAFQAIEHDVRAPMLALDTIRRDSRGFIFTPEMDVFEGSTRLAEIDLLALVDGAIVIGEAKTTNRLDDKEEAERAIARRLRRVTEATTAHELVMATTEDNWSIRTLKILQEETKGRPPLRLLGGIGR